MSLRIPPLARAAALCGLALGAASLFGCAAAGIAPPPRPPYTDIPIVPPKAMFWTHFRAPLILPIDIEMGGQPIVENTREIYVKIPLPFVPGPDPDFAFGRVDVENAARKAGIKRLTHADYEFTSLLSFLPLYESMQIHAYGYAE